MTRIILKEIHFYIFMFANCIPFSLKLVISNTPFTIVLTLKDEGAGAKGL